MRGTLKELYEIVGISKQAVHQHIKRKDEFNRKLESLIWEVMELREEHPGIGLEKMYYTLNPDFLGRDKFIEIFSELGFKLKKKRVSWRTTYRGEIYYPNLIEGLVVSGANEVWQSDITYFRVGERFYYLVFIIDVYTKEIVGYNVSDNLRAEANMKALMMAVSRHGYPKIHHSDRGSQYTYKPYVAKLEENGVKLSMSVYAFENAYAERINRTIKEEYLQYRSIKNLAQLQKETKLAVKHYNEKRIHNHIGRMTPKAFAKYYITLDQQTRPKVIISTEGKGKVMRVSNPHNFKQTLPQDDISPKVN